jgi:hypothetical protein
MAYTTTTRATLRSRIKDYLVPNYWIDAELDAYINEALRVFNVLTGYHKQTSSPTITANTRFYDVEGNVANHLAVLRVNLADTSLDLIDIEAKDAADEDWQNSTSGTSTDAMPLGLNYVALDPPPSGNTAYNITSLTISPIPANDAAYINLNEEDIRSIINYVRFICTIKEGGQEMQNAFPMLQAFLAHCANYNAKLNSSSAYRRLMRVGQRLQRPKASESQTP